MQRWAGAHFQGPPAPVVYTSGSNCFGRALGFLRGAWGMYTRDHSEAGSCRPLPPQLWPETSYFYLFYIQAHLRDIAGSAPNHCNKANLAIKQVTGTFWFSSAYKSYVYTTVVY